MSPSFAGAGTRGPRPITRLRRPWREERARVPAPLASLVERGAREPPASPDRHLAVVRIRTGTYNLPIVANRTSQAAETLQFLAGSGGVASGGDRVIHLVGEEDRLGDFLHRFAGVHAGLADAVESL